MEVWGVGGEKGRVEDERVMRRNRMERQRRAGVGDDASNSSLDFWGEPRAGQERPQMPQRRMDAALQ